MSDLFFIFAQRKFFFLKKGNILTLWVFFVCFVNINITKVCMGN